MGPLLHPLYDPPNYTLPPQNRTIPPFTHDLIPDTVVDMGGATHTRTSNTWIQTNTHLGAAEGGGQTDHTRLGDTGLVGRQHVSVSIRGGGELGE